MNLSGIRLHDLTLSYDRHPAVHHLSGVFAAGSLTAVIGPNGAGKSTLLRGLMGEVRDQQGRVELAGLSRRDIAYLPQVAQVERHFPLTVADTVLLGAWREMGAFAAAGPAQVQRASQALQRVGLAGFERRSIAALSAGQFQRVLFARLLVQDAPVILLDEPFNAIDAHTLADLLRIVLDWHAEGRTVIAVLHDFEQVREHFPQALLLAHELIAWGDTAEVVTTENLRRARAMAEQWDERAEVCQGAPR